MLQDTTGKPKFSDSRPWSGQERRAVCPSVTPLTEEYLGEKFEELTTLIKSGVPDGDMDSHRKYHELLIRQAERKEKFQQAIIEKTLSSLIWSGLVGVGYLLLAYANTHLGKSNGL